MPIPNATLLEDLNVQFGDFLTDAHEPYGLLTITTTPEKINEVLLYLFNHSEFKFQFLTDICGIHLPENTGAELGVVYHLHSLETNTRLRFKVFVPENAPIVPTVSEVFSSANWMERETYDFYGIIFSGHPNLIRILNMEDMDYFPLRKQYTLEDPTRRDKIDAKFGR
jgi:NADH-quinone oxidoreductase subunit C